MKRKLQPTETPVSPKKAKSKGNATPRRKGAAIAKQETAETIVEVDIETKLEKRGKVETVQKPIAKKRKTKEEKKAEMVPLATRTTGSKLFIGAHVSSAGGVQNSVLNSIHIG